MDFQQALDSIRPAESILDKDAAEPADDPMGRVNRGMDRQQRDRALVSDVHNTANEILVKKRESPSDRYEVQVWLVTLEVWDAMLRLVGFDGKTPELRWEAIPIVPTNLDLPAGIALATLDDVNATAARMTD